MTSKKITATLLIVIYVLSATAVGEFFKLPLLVTHYYNHREENKAIEVAQFLFMHYCYEKDTDNDAKEDGQLPFKSFAIASAESFISTIPSLNSALVTRPVSRTESFGYYVNLFFPSQYFNSIWQPPRYC